LTRPAYYNDNDPRCAAWLRELIADGLIPPGDVDERSILDVTAADLAGYEQCHFFAGIGGWPLALQLAGWSGPVWTGSCPCQPFSCAGKRQGEADKRHLWPEFRRLIAERNPPAVFGEQVASKDGRLWLAGVRADLEALGYAVGAADLCAAGIGAPHIRQRLFWVAESAGARCNGPLQGAEGETRDEARMRLSGADGGDGRMAHPDGRIPCDGEIQRSGEHAERDQDGGAGGGMGDPESLGRSGRQDNENGGRRECPSGYSGEDGRLVNPNSQRCNRQPIHLRGGESREDLPEAAGTSSLGFWSRSIWLPCRDGKARRIEPSIFPLADGVPGRVGLLRGAGNAIVPEVAAEFVKAYLEVQS
jgi:DNA (cytosine-5)-methyltransferase 1